MRMLEPVDQWLVAVQDGVREDFGWSEEQDFNTAQELLSSLEKIPQWSIEKRSETLESVRSQLLSDLRPIAVLGAAVEPEDLLSLFTLKPHIVAADGSVGVLNAVEEDMWRDLALVISDSDGWPHLQDAIDRTIPIALHAHGDNARELNKFIENCSEKGDLGIFLTHQTTRNIEGMYNPGGFTDGDRSICILLAMGVKVDRLVLVGFDQYSLGRWSGVTDENLKRRKLGWMAKILDRMGFGDGS